MYVGEQQGKLLHLAAGRRGNRHTRVVQGEQQADVARQLVAGQDGHVDGRGNLRQRIKH